MDPGPCPDEETLATFAEGRLSSREASTLGTHTESCAACRRVVGLLMKLRSDIRGVGDVNRNDGIEGW